MQTIFCRFPLMENLGSICTFPTVICIRSNMFMWRMRILHVHSSEEKAVLLRTVAGGPRSTISLAEAGRGRVVDVDTSKGNLAIKFRLRQTDGWDSSRMMVIKSKPKSDNINPCFMLWLEPKGNDLHGRLKRNIDFCFCFSWRKFLHCSIYQVIGWWHQHAWKDF